MSFLPKPGFLQTAESAAENYEKFKFLGFIGPGASAETTVFVNIERPTLIQVLNVQKQVGVPPIEWYVVDCVPDATSRSGMNMAPAFCLFPPTPTHPLPLQRISTGKNN